MTQEALAAKARHIVAGRRQRATTAALEARARAETALPALSALEGKAFATGIRAAQLSAAGAIHGDVEAALASVRAAQEQVDALLREHGFDPATLEPQYTCTLCGDTGRQGGKTCSCVQELIRGMRREAVNVSSPLSLCSFTTFTLDKYPTQIIPAYGVSAREQMQQILEYCKSYAAHFSRKNASLYLCGYAGLGKTHLALSIANEVLSQGFDVVYVSAQDAFDRMEKERFGEPGNTLRTLEGAELLILDDLGTEYITPYVSACLYSLINTRCSRRLPTLYTSNIVNDADLRRRYTEKIVSRLLGSCEVLTVCGEDIRLQGK